MRFTIIMLLFLSPYLSRAEENPYCNYQDYSSVITPDFNCPSPGESDLIPELEYPDAVPIMVNQRITAPWDGALVHRNKLIEVGLKITSIRRLRWLDQLRLDELHQAEIEAIQAVHDVQLQAVDKERQRAANALKARKAWYRSVWFGFTLGVVVTAAATLGISFAIAN